MDQLPWDGIFTESALGVFDDRSFTPTFDLSALAAATSGDDGHNLASTTQVIDFANNFNHQFTHHQFALSDARDTYPTPPSNLESSPPVLMPPPPLPYKVQQHRLQHQRHMARQQGRRRSSGPTSAGSPATIRTSSSPSSSIPATSPVYHLNTNSTPAGLSPGSQQARQHPQPRSPDGHPTHQSPEEFQVAVQTQEPSSTTEASDSLFKDWMNVNYKSEKLPDDDTSTDDYQDHSANGEEGGQSNTHDAAYEGEENEEERNPKRREGSQVIVGELLRWGSDSNFGEVQTHYTPGPQKETVETMHDFQLTLLDCLQVNSHNQTEDVQHSHWKQEESNEPPKLRTNPSYRATLPTKEPSSQPDNNSTEDTPRIKRRKTSQDSIEEPPETAKPIAPKRKRRRRNKDDAKDWQTRPVLTDEQRRQNHIKSEKKRRILINEGFDDLCALVPSLGKGKFCKSTVLLLAGQWLEGLLEGNKSLERQLADLTGDAGG